MILPVHDGRSFGLCHHNIVMQIHNGTIDKKVVEWVVGSTGTDRIVSLDLETKVIDRKFLNGETLLSACLSRRIDGSVRTQMLVLEEETPEAERRLLENLDASLGLIKPLVLVGFSHTGYDNVLLALKHRQAGLRPLWNIVDALERCHMVDVKHAARFSIAQHDGTTPKILSLDKVLSHPLFSDLPLRNEKGLLNGPLEKGEMIYNMWKNEPEKFRRYAEGDSHDTLLVFERIFDVLRNGNQ